MNHDVFVKAWLKHPNPDAVAKELGRGRGYVSQIATKLRKLGVQLPMKPRGTKAEPVDVSALNEIIARAAKVQR